MDGNPEQQLMEEFKNSQKTGNLLEENESPFKKHKSTTDDSNPSVKQTPLVNDVTNQLMDIDLVLESNQQQPKLALKQDLSTPSDLPTSTDRQSEANQMEDAKITINQQVKLSKDNKCQNEAKLNPIVQTLFNGTLPDDVYLHLLSVMGIQECLISNRLVCSLWNELVLERCRNQKSLKVFETFHCLVNYCELLLECEKTEDTSLVLKSVGDDLLFERFETDYKKEVDSLYLEEYEEFFTFEGDVQKEGLTRKEKLEASKVLTVLFPRVEELVLCTKEYFFIKSSINIEHLLQFYAGQLTSLTMTDFGRLNSDSKLLDFSFPKLKSLHTFHYSPDEDQLLSLLPQLESLTMVSTEIRLETLLRTGTQLRQLSIGVIQSVYSEPVTEFTKRPRITSNLRKFSFVATQNEVQLLEVISQNLTSLEALKLDLLFFLDHTVSRLHSVATYLVPLTQLHSLTLKAPVSFFLLDDSQLPQIKPQPSVRVLKLHLWGFSSLPLEYMDLFSRSLFAAFSNVEQVLIDHSDVDSDTMAAFEDFAGQHPNVVQLFRCKKMSKFAKLPNGVSPLLGHHRQVYEECIEEEELFGVAILKLAASLVTRQGGERLNLKSALRPADRLSAMSNLLQLLERDAFTFDFSMVNTMIQHMVKCALKYGPSQVALFTVTCKCILSLGGSATKVDMLSIMLGDTFFKLMLQLVEHYGTQQFKDAELLLQMHQSMDALITEMMCKKYKFQFECVIDQFRDDNPVYRVETARALLRICNRAKNCLRSK